MKVITLLLLLFISTTYSQEKSLKKLVAEIGKSNTYRLLGKLVPALPGAYACLA